jgi:diguanylate cyclase (GGDEF)-like protein
MLYLLLKEWTGMSMQIRTQRDVWKMTILITVFALTVSELCMAGLYLSAGAGAFTMQNSIIMAALLPLIIAWPITYHVCHMSLELANTQAELRHLANTDPLTRLPNRRSFFSDARRLLDDDAALAALLVIDADHFKDINDSYGHAVGDKALVAIADVLRASFRDSDLICRVGGEEFAVLVPGMTMHEAGVLATRVVERVAANPLSEANAIIEYSVSCGISDTSASSDLQSLFKTADDAMYLAKKQGRNRVASLSAAA